MKVSTIKCNDYNPVSVKKAISDAITELGGINNFAKKGETILLKPNLLVGSNPNRAVTTHPEVVRATAQIIRQAGAVPVIGDCPSPANTLKYALKKSRIYQVCLDENIKIIDMERKTTVNVNGKLIKIFTLSKAIEEINGIFNLCKFKTHMFTILTGAVKNLYGLIPGTVKLRYHATLQTPELFSEMLLDLYLATKNKIRLNIMDGVLGMQGQGPYAGDTIWPKMIIASKDALSLDSIFAEITGAKDKFILTNLAKKRNLLKTASCTNLRFPVKLPTTARTFPKILNNIVKAVFIKKPVINNKVCIACLKCKKICPVNAIQKNHTQKKPVIIQKKCIRCYCCHEICPSKAIEIKGTLGF